MEKCSHISEAIAQASADADNLYRDGIVGMPARASGKCPIDKCPFMAVVACPSGVVTEINQCGEESKSPQESSKIIT